MTGEEILKGLVNRESESRTMAALAKTTEEPTNNEADGSLPEPAQEFPGNDKKESFIWADQAVLLFLELYRTKEPEFSMKRHTKIWEEIASDMRKANYNVSATQCQNKMSGLKRTYKHISDSNKKSGNHTSSWAFYSVMESLFSEKAWVEPAAIGSSDGPQSPGCSTSSQTSTDEPKQKKRRVETILESFIADIKEDRQKEKKKKKRRLEQRVEKENKWKQMQQERREMHNNRMKYQMMLIELMTKIAERK